MQNAKGASSGCCGICDMAENFRKSNIEKLEQRVIILTCSKEGESSYKHGMPQSCKARENDGSFERAEKATTRGVVPRSGRVDLPKVMKPSDQCGISSCTVRQ